MSLIKQPYELNGSPSLVMMIYGEPGVGKTSLALSAPNPLLVDFESGIYRVDAQYRKPVVQVSSWDDVQQLLQSDEIKQFDSIIIDTCGKLMDYLTEYLIRENPKLSKRDGNLSLEGYGVRKYEFKKFIDKLRILFKNIIFIAHATESKDDRDTRLVRPVVGGSSVDDLTTELNLMGYMYAARKKKFISFQSTENWYAKNTVGLPDEIEIPSWDKHPENNFIQEVIIKSYQDKIRKENELKRQYDIQVNGYMEAISQAKTAEDINKVLEKYLAEDNWIFDSRIKVRRAMVDKANQLNLTYDSNTNKYVNKN